MLINEPSPCSQEQGDRQGKNLSNTFQEMPSDPRLLEPALFNIMSIPHDKLM